jgi:hypothetical protein
VYHLTWDRLDACHPTLHFLGWVICRDTKPVAVWRR